MEKKWLVRLIGPKWLDGPLLTLLQSRKLILPQPRRFLHPPSSTGSSSFRISKTAQVDEKESPHASIAQVEAPPSPISNVLKRLKPPAPASPINQIYECEKDAVAGKQMTQSTCMQSSIISFGPGARYKKARPICRLQLLHLDGPAKEVQAFCVGRLQAH